MNFHSRLVFLAFLLAATTWLSSCSNAGGNSTFDVFSSDYVDQDDFSSVLKQQLQPVDTTDSLVKDMILRDAATNLRLTYQLNGYKPVWFNTKGLKKSAAQLILQIEELKNEGISRDYRLPYLASIAKQAAEVKEPSADTVVAWDKAFSEAYLQAALDLLMGTGGYSAKDPQWYAGNDLEFTGAAVLAGRTAADTVLSFDHFRPVNKRYAAMLLAVKQWQQLATDSAYIASKQHLNKSTDEAAALTLISKETGVATEANDTANQESIIKHYQYLHQLRQSGKLDSATVATLGVKPEDYISKLQLNMTRLRRLPRELAGEYVWVNIPLMELEYLRDEESLFQSRVVVGKVSRQTPSILASMTNIVFNPPWGVPPTILKNDIGPGVSRSGSGYLARKGLKAYDAKGNDVTGSVTGANYKRFSYRQAPGAGNALGEIKFNLPNKWDIYIHDTPHRENFGSKMRALSSGCVRVQNPKDFAHIILEDKKYSMGRIDSVIQTRKTKAEKLGRKVEVYIVYMTVASDSTGTNLIYLNDIYKRDAAFSEPEEEQLAANK